MPKGGARKGAGRKARPTSKAKGIWCGQITDEQRDFIMQWLSPEDRYGVLMAAANKACSGLACTCPKILNGRDTLCPIHGDLHKSASR
jgi:hypothetical protein